MEILNKKKKIQIKLKTSDQLQEVFNDSKIKIGLELINAIKPP